MHIPTTNGLFCLGTICSHRTTIQWVRYEEKIEMISLLVVVAVWLHCVKKLVPDNKKIRKKTNRRERGKMNLKKHSTHCFHGHFTKCHRFSKHGVSAGQNRHKYSRCLQAEVRSNMYQCVPINIHTCLVVVQHSWPSLIQTTHTLHALGVCCSWVFNVTRCCRRGWEGHEVYNGTQQIVWMLVTVTPLHCMMH